MTSLQDRARRIFDHRWGEHGKCLELVGTGSFGNVFRLSTPRRMVVKICDVSDSYASLVVKREVVIMKMCDHPNVMRLLCNERWERYAYLFMECCTPLPVFLRNRLTSEQLDESVCGFVSGVAYLHEKRIMHRDLKPQNLLVTADGRLVITDFGLSVHVSDEMKWDEGRQDEAYTKEVCTRWWRAPEIILEIPYSWRIDIWSMGCIVYELALNMLGAVNVVLLPAPHTRDDDEAELDQLSLILDLLGSPSTEDKAYLTSSPQREYAMKTLKDGVSPKPFPPDMPWCYRDVIEKTLRWKPHDRLCAGTILETVQNAGAKKPRL
jgi:serine/threonine protein kinase